jgi:hypothetical protein
MLKGSRVRFSYRNWLEDRVFDLAWLLPRRLVEACFVRIFAHSTTGEWSKLPSDITCFEAMRRWDPRPRENRKGTIGQAKAEAMFFTASNNRTEG